MIDPNIIALNVKLALLQRKVDLLTLLLGVNVITTGALIYFVVERLP